MLAFILVNIIIISAILKLEHLKGENIERAEIIESLFVLNQF